MFDDLKKDIRLIASAVEARLTPQWAAPQLLCRFRRDAAAWEFSYLAPSAQGQSGALLQLTRNGKSRFDITLNHPDIELAQWRDALRELTSSDQRDADWWLRLFLRLRGWRIECSRLVMQEQTIIDATAKDVDRYYVARLCGWTQPCVLIVHTDNFKTSNGGKISSNSVRLLPGECHQMAEALHRLTNGPTAKPLAPLPQNMFNQRRTVSAKLIVLIILAVVAVWIAATVLPLGWLLAHH